MVCSATINDEARVAEDNAEWRGSYAPTTLHTENGARRQNMHQVYENELEFNVFSNQ